MFTRESASHRAWGRAMRAGGGLVSSVMLAVGVCGSVSAQGDGATARDLSVEQAAVYGVQVPVSTSVPAQGRLSVTAWVDHADNTYAVGEQVRLFVRSNKDAYLTVLNVGASGRTTVLFPNAYQTDTRIRAHEVVEVPARGSGASIRVSGPTGRELIKVIASTSPTPLLGSSGSVQSGVFRTLEADARSVARDLQVTMQGHSAGYEWDDYNKVITTIGSRPVATLPPLQPAPTGTVWPASVYGLRVATDRPSYRLGESVRVYASTTQPCYLTLFNVGPSGQVRVLLPNAMQPQTLLPGGQVMVFPAQGMELRPMGPAGLETLLAVCSSDSEPVRPGGWSYGRGGFAQLSGGSGELERDLSVVATVPNRQVSQATVGYVVTR